MGTMVDQSFDLGFVNLKIKAGASSSRIEFYLGGNFNVPGIGEMQIPGTKKLDIDLDHWEKQHPVSLVPGLTTKIGLKGNGDDVDLGLYAADPTRMIFAQTVPITSVKKSDLGIK